MTLWEWVACYIEIGGGIQRGGRGKVLEMGVIEVVQGLIQLLMSRWEYALKGQKE